jgi:fatty-acyl-CoA synthase
MSALKSEADIENQLLGLVRYFLTETEAERAKRIVTLDAALESDLGLGSLEKAELFQRIEKHFEIQLPDSLLVEAIYLRDLIHPIKKAGPRIKKPLNHEIYAHIAAANIDLSNVKTLAEVLTEYAINEPERIHIYFQDEQGNEQPIRYGELYESASAVARGLVERGLRQAETVAIMLPTSLEFFYAFFGVLLAGGVAVPIYPPFRPDQIEEYAKREALILRNAEVRFLITFQQAEGLSNLLSSFIPSLKEVVTVKLLQTSKVDLPQLIINEHDSAFIQYTSGSTGDPKGVLLSHYNLLSNIRAFGKAVDLKPSDVVVSWLPLYHDMGLIGTWLGSLYHGIQLVILSPLSFLTHPERWLWAIHYHRGTLSAGPNFAYELCERKINEDSLEGLDLSCWRLAFNGAEAIYPKTLEKFAKKFKPYGFKLESFFPVYGLAESTVALTFPPLGRAPLIDKIARDPFEAQGRAIPINPNEKNMLEFVACGKPLPQHEIRIMNENDEIVEERMVGNLQFRGPSSMQGYYHNPKATNEIYHDGWWSSGDLAYIANGEVYITGRKKDVIIKAGRNLYPPEIEEIVNHIVGIRKGCVVAFGAKDVDRGTEKLIVVAETIEKNGDKRSSIIKEIMEKVAENIGMPPDHVILVLPHTIPKTSSGKLRRSSCQREYLQGKLERGTVPTWIQVGKLFLQSSVKKISRYLGKVAKFIYTLYFTLVLIITLLPVYLVAHILSRSALGKLCRCWANGFLKLIMCPLIIKNKKNLTVVSPVIYVSNHVSYMDAVALCAVLPFDVAVVGKKELLELPILGTLFKKLGHLAVDRLDFAQSLADTQQFAETLRQGRSVAIFPEGTFAYATGLRPFKLGAFKLAVETKTPICPVTLRGTRYILRDGSRLLRPGIIYVTVSSPVFPENQEWQSVIQLRNAARLEIAKHCGEPAIDLIKAGLEKKA